MIFENFFDAWFFLMASIFGLSLVLGFTTGKTNFCTLGAISDWVNFQDKSRMRAWVLAMAVAIMSMGVLEYIGLVDISESFPNYRTSNIIWGELVFGGLLFGIGMTFASGCGNKTLVRVGGGDVNSFLTLAGMAISGYYMYNAFPGSDSTIFSALFADWLSPLAYELTVPQDISSIAYIILPALDVVDISVFRLIFASTFSLLLFYWVFIGKTEVIHKVSGMIVGLCVVSFWVISNNTYISYDGENHLPHKYMADWEMAYEVPEYMEAEVDDVNDLRPRGVDSYRPQSFSFVGPAASVFGLAKEAVSRTVKVRELDEKKLSLKVFLNMGVFVVLGIILGSFASAITEKSFGIKFYKSGTTIFRNLASGVLMGVGGVLAMGCTIGQGVTGVSTMAIGSFLSLFSIILGSYGTHRIIYWLLMRK